MKFVKKEKSSIKTGRLIKFSSYIFTILIIFILGLWTEKYDLIEKPKALIIEKPKALIQEIAQKIYEKISSKIIEAEKITIDIKLENFKKIIKARETGLQNTRLRDEDSEWVSGKLEYNNEKNKIKIRLKGTHADHWEHPYKWSFKIKLSDGKRLFNLARFSIQPPQTILFLYEWLFMKALEEEGLISHRIKFVKVVLNGNYLGIYALQDQASKELIEFNNRKEGPIITFNKDLWIEEFNAESIDLGYNNKFANFWRSKITPVQFKKKNLGTIQEKYLNQAIFLLESFRNKKLKPSEVFDLDQLAKLMAIEAVFGAIEFDTNDIKFYYNPTTKLLEPIGKEVHTDHKEFPSYSAWIFNIDEMAIPWMKHFLKLLYNDKIFYKKFLSELSRFSKNNYIENIIDKNKDEFDKYKKILQDSYPLDDIINLDDIRNTANFINSSLNPIQKIKVNLIKLENNNLTLNIKNTQALPLEILGLSKKNQEILIKKPVLIGGFKVNQMNDRNHIQISCKDIICSKDTLSEIKIVYKILGQEKFNYSEIDFWNNDNYFKTFQKKADLSDLDKIDFLNIKDNIIEFKKGTWILDQLIIIPEDFELLVKENTNIIFQGEGQIISFSPIKLNGTVAKPITISSNFNGNLNEYRSSSFNDKSYGNGILVLNSNKKSTIKNVIFNKLSSPPTNTGDGLLGAINFYQSDVDIINSKFINNLRGDDFINIIRSNFLISNSYFENSNSDAIDLDFSKGIIKNTIFNKSVNDAIDFSGSEVELSNIEIDKAGDKAISVGEKSFINANKIRITNSNIGIASKDNSLVNMNSIIINNVEIGVVAYTKKAEYGPAKIEIKELNISNYNKNFISDIGSEIIINGKKIENTNCEKNLSICPFLNN